MGKLQAAWQLARFKYDQRCRGFNVPDEPYFDTFSLPEFVRLLSGCRSYLEFGSGGSTIAAARLKVPTITVESDRFYAAAVAERLSPGSDHQMVVVDIGVTREWGYPLFKRPTARRLGRWSRYVRQPYDHVGGGFPDLVLVDGRFRRACALEAARQAQSRGVATTIFLDDYAGRAYASVERELGAPRMAGRAAIFAVDGSSRQIDVAAVEEALRDPR